MLTLGISYGYHDSSAAIVADGVLIAAATEERFTRKKHDSSFPEYAIRYCLESAGVASSEIDFVVYHEEPGRKLNRILCSSFAAFPKTRREFTESMRSWMGSKLWTLGTISKRLGVGHEKIKNLSHHFSHAATAFMGSPFSEATILVADAVGEWNSTVVYEGEKNEGKPSIRKIKEINFPHSLGLVYSAITSYLGFNPNDEECSTMALAAFGRPTYLKQLEEIVQQDADGTFKVDTSYFHFCDFYRGACSNRFISRFGKGRDPHEILSVDCLKNLDEQSWDSRTQHLVDMACSVQTLYERHLVRLAQSLNLGSKTNLCIAGGSALNCVANSVLLKQLGCSSVYIPPDPGDGGTSVGTALYIDALEGKGNHRSTGYFPFIGKEYDEKHEWEMLEAIRPHRFAKFRKRGTEFSGNWIYRQYDDFGELAKEVALDIHRGKIVGWIQGRFESGPRALGNRSIFIRPDDCILAKHLSTKVKDRAPFRPYALSVTESHAKEILEIEDLQSFPLKWMQLAVKVRESARKKVRAAMHVDFTTRPQVCFPEDNAKLYELLKAYGQVSGFEALLNTSFNGSGYPMVSSPILGLVQFARTEMDAIVLGNLVVRKERS